jgi:YesN/AraC family two-component response regulator
MYSIYIVDDEQPIIERLLTSIPWLEHGFDVIGSNTNPPAALTEIVGLKPDVVFTDLKMPGLTGIELFKELRARGEAAEFVMLSAFDAFDAVREFFTMGGVDYILKPLDLENAAQVLEKVSRILAEKAGRVPSVQFKPSPSQGFDTLIQYVTENFNKKHTLLGLSERFSLNPTYICDLFSKQYDSTLVIFLTNLRVKNAARLILESDAPLKEIAAFCGYQDYQWFAKLFKQHFGQTPTKYRENPPPRNGEVE